MRRPQGLPGCVRRSQDATTRQFEYLPVSYLRLVTGTGGSLATRRICSIAASGFLVHHDVKQDDRDPLSQGHRLAAPAEVPDWCVELEKAERSRCLAVP